MAARLVLLLLHRFVVLSPNGRKVGVGRVMSSLLVAQGAFTR